MQFKTLTINKKKGAAAVLNTIQRYKMRLKFQKFYISFTYV